MEDSLQKVIAIVIAIIAFFVLPVYMTFEKKDDISYSLALKITTDFVENVRSKGYLTSEMYDDFISNLAVTGNSYDIKMEHVAKKYYPVIYAYNDEMNEVIKKFDYNLYHAEFEVDKKIVIEDGVDAGTYENLILAYDLAEEKYTQDQILSVISKENDGINIDIGLTEYENLEITELPTLSNIYRLGKSNNGIYTMNIGDEFGIIIKNNNTTFATSLFNLITLGANSDNNTKVYINYGGVIKNEEYRDKLVDEDTQNYNVADDEDVTPSLAGKYVEKGLVVLLDGENNAGAVHSNSANVWTDLSGNNHHATLSGFDFSDTSGWIYNGLKFSGKEYVELGNFNNDEITIEVVVKLDNLVNAETVEQSIVSNLNNGGYGILYAQTNHLSAIKKGKFGFEVYQKLGEEKTASSVYSDKVVEQNKIYSLSASMGPDDLGGIKQVFSQNGEIDGIVLNGEFEPTNTGTKLTIGAQAFAGVNAVPQLKGTIYSIRVYNRALTEEEIKQNYEVDKIKYNLN